MFDLEKLCNPKIEDSKLWRRVTQAVQGESDVLVVVNKRALVISEKSGLWVRDVWEGTIPRLDFQVKRNRKLYTFNAEHDTIIMFLIFWPQYGDCMEDAASKGFGTQSSPSSLSNHGEALVSSPLFSEPLFEQSLGTK